LLTRSSPPRHRRRPTIRLSVCSTASTRSCTSSTIPRPPRPRGCLHPGFRPLLEMPRAAVPRGYGNSYFWVKPDRIVPLHLVREVPERLNFRGEVLRPFDESVAGEVARWFRHRGIDSIGVSFIHAYANPEHEQRMRAILEHEHPGAHVSISSEVLPEYREYERTVTTVVDAFVKSRVANYVGAIQARLDTELGAGVPFYVMKSNGGVISARQVAARPITTIPSGPAARPPRGRLL